MTCELQLNTALSVQLRVATMSRCGNDSVVSQQQAEINDNRSIDHDQWVTLTFDLAFR